MYFIYMRAYLKEDMSTCVYVFKCTLVCTCIETPYACRNPQKSEGIRFLELELQIVGRHNVGVENQTWVTL